jgi:hypothetical protein
VSRVKAAKFEVARGAADVTIEDKAFRLTVDDVTAAFTLHWEWASDRASFLRGAGGAALMLPVATTRAGFLRGAGGALVAARAACSHTARGGGGACYGLS